MTFEQKISQEIKRIYRKICSLWAAVETLQTDVTTITADVTNLKNNELKITYYAIVTGASGTITPPTGATFNSGEFGNSGNSILSRINGSNKCTYESPQMAGGVVVTANLNTTTGAWIASGVYTDTNVALIYSINIKEKDYANLNPFYIIDETKLITVTAVTASSPLASSGGTAPNITITQSGTVTNGYLSSTDWNTFNNKQDTLVSGTTIKTINGISVLGSGDITIASGVEIDVTPITSGGANRILFESATNKVSESANLTYASGLLKVEGTTSQFRAGYSASVYSNYKVDSAGNVEIKNQGGTTYSGNSLAIIGDNIYNTFIVGRYNNQGQFLTIGQASIDTPMQIKTNYWSTDVPVTIGTYTSPNAIKVYVNGRINFGYLPTSSVGLVSGDIWNDTGTLKIV